MAGYLDQYGAGDERRIRTIKTIAIAVAALILIGGPLLFIFHNYRMDMFLQDWGPARVDVSNVRIERSRICGSVVILTVDFDKNRQEKLWVQRDDLTIGFSPMQGCPVPK